jgi:hypothetical protein
MSIVHFEADELLPQLVVGQVVQGGPANEVRLVQLDRPGQAGLDRRGERVGILRDDNVALFEAQDTLRFDAEGRDAVFLAGFQEEVPLILAVFGGDGLLVA